MSRYQTAVARKLHAAYLKSGMTPVEFYNHIISTRGHSIVSVRLNELSFKIHVPEYGDDIEWYGWDEQSQLWLEL